MIEEDSKTTTTTAVAQALNKFIQAQKDTSKIARKNSLEALKKQLIDNFKTDSQSALNFPDESLKLVLKMCLSSLSDVAEKCRELSADIVRLLLENDGKKSAFWTDESTSSVVMTLNQRLGGREVKEASEEIRLQLYNLLVQLVELKSADHVHTFEVHLTELVGLMQNAIGDNYPEVKKVGCQCAKLVANRLAKGNFHMQSETLVKTLLANIVHQHSRVRKDIIDCLCDVVMYGNNKSVSDSCSHLAQRLFDQASIVRSSVIRLVATWLLDLPDRYSYQHKLIPLLLTGLVDEALEIKEMAESLWWDVGVKYERENDQDLKDKSDFLNKPLDTYPTEFKDRRPNLGCRELVRLNASRILPGLLNDIGDWVEATRVKSAELLYVMIWQCEKNITQHLETVLQTLFKSCGESSPVIQTNLFNCARLLGFFTDPSITLTFVFKSMRKMSPGPNPGSVSLLNGLLIGFGSSSSSEKLAPLIVEALTLLDQIALTLDVKLHSKILDCIGSIWQILQGNADLKAQSEYLIFKVVFTVSALANDSDLKGKSNEILGNLDKETLKNVFVEKFINEIKANCDAWNDNSLEPLIFAKILNDWGLYEQINGQVMDILKKITNPNKDAQLRTRFILLLPELIVPSSQEKESSQRAYDEVIVDMLLPNLIWKAGRAASAVRMSTAASLALLTQSIDQLRIDNPSATVDALTKQVLSCLDDDQKPTRLYACKIFSALLTSSTLSAHLSVDQLHKFYVEFIKRLDDQSDEIRSEIVRVFSAYFACLKSASSYDKILYKAHLQTIYENLLLYLDDSDSSFQQKILGLLKQGSSLYPELLVEEAEKVKGKHRSAVYCEELINFCKGITN